MKENRKSEGRPSHQALKRLNALRRRVGGKHVLDVLQKLEHGYNEWRNLKRETKDINLLKANTCDFRFEHEGNYYCGRYAPRTVRKLLTLKICEVCRCNARHVQPQPKMLVGNDGDLSSHEFAEQARRKMRQQQPSKSLVSENILHTCRQASENLPLMQLPCVVQVDDPKNPDLKIGCRFVDCECRVKSKIGALYVKRD